MEKYLYDSNLLKNLAIKNDQFKYTIRPLMVDDFERGHLQLLSQLTKVGNVSDESYRAQFERMKKSGQYYVTVIVDEETDRLIASATLFTEYKFIHNCAKRGRIEDVIVDKEYRGQRLGNILIDTLKQLAQNMECYKLTLDCNDDMIPFYNKFSFQYEPGRSNLMTIRFNYD